MLWVLALAEARADVAVAVNVNGAYMLELLRASVSADNQTDVLLEGRFNFDIRQLFDQNIPFLSIPESLHMKSPAIVQLMGSATTPEVD